MYKRLFECTGEVMKAWEENGKYVFPLFPKHYKRGYAIGLHFNLTPNNPYEVVGWNKKQYQVRNHAGQLVLVDKRFMEKVYTPVSHEERMEWYKNDLLMAKVEGRGRVPKKPIDHKFENIALTNQYFIAKGFQNFKESMKPSKVQFQTSLKALANNTQLLNLLNLESCWSDMGQTQSEKIEPLARYLQDFGKDTPLLKAEDVLQFLIHKKNELEQPLISHFDKENRSIKEAFKNRKKDEKNT